MEERDKSLPDTGKEKQVVAFCANENCNEDQT